MPAPMIFDIIHIHSPVTYTVAKLMFAQGYIKNTPIVICSRNTKWDGPHISLPHLHALHNFAVCEFLAQLAKHFPEDGNFRINLYLPHIGHQFGRILMLSGLVDHLYYIEEGDCAYTPEEMEHACYYQKTHVLQLIRWLTELGVTDRYKLDVAALGNFNQFNPPQQCGTLPKNAGAYALFPEAFPLLSNVTVLDIKALPTLPAPNKAWLLLLQTISYEFHEEKNSHAEQEKILHGLKKIIETHQAFTRFIGYELVIKLHPDDEVMLGKTQFNFIANLAKPYSRFLEEQQLPPGYEPVFYQFGGYSILGTSSATRYTQLMGLQNRTISLSW